MAKDIAELVNEYLPEEPNKWGKLSSELQYRRLNLMLLREILLELRQLNRSASGKVL